MGWSLSGSIGCLEGAAAGLGCDLPCLSPAFLPPSWDFLFLHKMSCVFTGQHFSPFPNLHMSFEAPFAGFLAAKDVLVALGLFWGWRSGKHPLNRCQPIPILPSPHVTGSAVCPCTEEHGATCWEKAKSSKGKYIFWKGCVYLPLFIFLKLSD